MGWFKELLGFGTPEPVEEETPAFVGTSNDLLALATAHQEAKEAQRQQKQDMTDAYWLNLEYLKLALQITESSNQRKVFYVDVGNLPAKKAEEHMKAMSERFQDLNGNVWLPRREGGRGTEVVTLPPGGATLESVLETARKLKEFTSK